jgi:stage II sporulation protein M
LTSRFTADKPILPYFLILSSLFSVALLVGFVAPPSIRQPVNEAFQVFVDQYRDRSGGSLFFFILLHNVMASLLLVGSGLLFGIIPTLAICSNGFILGVVYRQGAEMFGYTKAALQVFPHGVFEIPALLFASSYGLWLGMSVLRRIRRKENTLLRFHIEHAFRRYFAVVFPLLIVAAAIETFVILKAQ